MTEELSCESFPVSFFLFLRDGERRQKPDDSEDVQPLRYLASLGGIRSPELGKDVLTVTAYSMDAYTERRGYHLAGIAVVYQAEDFGFTFGKDVIGSDLFGRDFPSGEKVAENGIRTHLRGIV